MTKPRARGHTDLGPSFYPGSVLLCIGGGSQLDLLAQQKGPWEPVDFRAHQTGPAWGTWRSWKQEALPRCRRPRVCMLAQLTASLTGLVPVFMTSKLSHCLSQWAQKQTLSKAMTQVLKRGKAYPTPGRTGLWTQSDNTGGSKAVVVVYFGDPHGCPLFSPSPRK